MMDSQLRASGVTGTKFVTTQFYDGLELTILMVANHTALDNHGNRMLMVTAIQILMAIATKTIVRVLLAQRLVDREYTDVLHCILNQKE